MSGSDSTAAFTLFGKAIDLPEEKREEWLSKACDDAGVRAHVERLLKRHEEAGLLDDPIVKRGESADLHVGGKRIGPWEIEEQIGAGGMGVVYRASRADGLYERTVALKLIAPNVALASGEQLARRLAAERHILAHLEHDGIARLYDGGVTEDGLPYLALELIDGEPITDYCNAHELGTAERVKLFARACDAVAYAHRSLVVHRDLKPAHVLVVKNNADGEPGVKLLDFGVSALLEAKAGGDPTGFTEPHALTPSYAAPEQIRGEPVTTATDVYSLGVVLYELLTLQRPYDLSAKTAAEVERTVIDMMPASPSVAAPSQQRVLRGDLDTIVMKALAKEPERRYASAEALAADLRRHLNGLPIEARPATTGYRVRKFVERHKVGVGAAAAVLLLVTALTTIYTVRLRAALDQAQTEATKAEEVNAFLLSMLSSVDPFLDDAGAVPESLTVAFMLRQAAATVDIDLAEQPDVLASVHRTIGLTFHNLGLFNEAKPHLDRALRLAMENYDEYLHPQVIQSMEDLANLAYDVDNIALFDSLQNRVVTLRRERYGNRSLEYASALARLGSTLSSAEADPLFTEALAIVREASGPRSIEAFEVLNAFAVQRHTVGDWPGADSLYSQAVEIAPDIELADHPTLAATLSSWAALSWFLGKSDQSASLVERALEIQEGRLPHDHPNLAQTRGMVAGILIEKGHYVEAERVLRHVKEVFEEQLPRWWAKHIAGTELAAALFGQRRDAEGEQLMREHLPEMRAQAGDNHGWTRHAIRHYVEFLDSRGRSSEADSLRHLEGF